MLATLRRAVAIVVVFAAIGRWFSGGRWSPVSRYVVEGPSMEPAYRAGDRLLVNRLAYRARPPRVGDVIVLRDPENQRRSLLKRVASPPAAAGCSARQIYVLGDNAAASRDSRMFGAVPVAQVVGRAWFRY